MRTVSHETAPNSRGTTRNGNRRRTTWPRCRPTASTVSPKATTHESLIDDEADSAAASMAIHDVVASSPHVPATRLALIGETDAPGCSATPHRR
jgi:hypothetical protein